MVSLNVSHGRSQRGEKEREEGRAEGGEEGRKRGGRKEGRAGNGVCTKKNL